MPDPNALYSGSCLEDDENHESSQGNKHEARIHTGSDDRPLTLMNAALDVLSRTEWGAKGSTPTNYRG